MLDEAKALEGLCPSFSAHVPSVEHGARRIQGSSATFPKEEIVAYAKKFSSSSFAGADFH
jgi:hypothetical protein